MTKIKILSVLLFILSITLIILFSYISNQNKVNSELLTTINEQKAFTQEISKNIFYIYKNKNTSTKQLDDSIKKFINNMNNKNEKLSQINSKSIENKSDEIIVLWNKFYLYVQNFRDQNKISTAYSSIIIEDIVNDIYKINLKLVVKFDELIQIHKTYFNDKLNKYKNIQYILFITFILLLLYLFMQLSSVISFMQKFISTSKNIISNSSIKELEPIKDTKKSVQISQATQSFNFLVNKINNSIEYSSSSIEHSYQSLEIVEKNIEDLLELISIMNNGKIDKDITKKEDVLIQSLEELTNSALNLKNLKVDLDNLISANNANKS